MRYQRAEFPLKLDGLEAARNFFAGCFADTDPALESLWVAHVDNRARCLHLTRHAGDESGMHLPLRSIIADAALHGSAGIVLAHNHPSGDARPSAADCGRRAGWRRRPKRSTARSSIIWCLPAPNAPACAEWVCFSPCKA